MGPPNLDNIPVEVLYDIVAEVTLPTDVLSLAMSCKSVWSVIGRDNNYLWYTWFSKIDSPTELRKKREEAEREFMRKRQERLAHIQATGMAMGIIPLSLQPPHLLIPPYRSVASGVDNGKEEPTDPFEKYDPDFEYYAFAMRCMTGNLKMGKGEKSRCQGCFKLTNGGANDYEPGNNMAFRGVLFCEYLDEDTGKQVKQWHSRMEERWYCDDCLPIFCTTNLKENEYFGYDISTVRNAGRGGHHSSHMTLKGMKLSFTNKYYLLSDLRRCLLNMHGCDARHLESMAAEAKMHRSRENDQSAAIIADALLHLVESDDKNSFLLGGLYNRDAWTKHLMAEWKEIAPFCIWGLDNHEKKVAMQEHYAFAKPKPRKNAYFDSSFYEDLESSEEDDYYYEDDLPVRPKTIAERKYDDTFKDNVFSILSAPPLGDEEGEDAGATEKWNKKAAGIVQTWLAKPVLDSHDRGEEEHTFLNKKIWEYAVSNGKFTAEQGGKAGLCSYCKVKKQYPPYVYAVHIYTNHKNRFYDEGKWSWRKKSEGAIKTVRELGVDELSQMSARNRSKGFMCVWDEEKKAMRLDGFKNYTLV